ncbi:alpha-tocopherol transfer protein-like [Phymastichus coffea]|uniref:alpha-tocopherol transfer protein-like n=1 Tax=Phymastichus coffea TaxID=108790 RepID=UPI00273A9B2D|nr:alpha-tocopherol transfer protein-like [Phymastichus coffea]
MNTLKRVSLEEEFKKNPELKQEDLDNLMDWYSKQPHFPQNVSKLDLVVFLHSNYYRLEPTKTTIENFLTCRTHVPEFFANRDPLGSKELRLIMGTLLVVPLEQKTPEGYGVIYSRLINYEPERFVYNDGMRLFNMIADLWALQNGTMKGHVLICDIVGVQMVHALRISPIGVKKYLYYLQEAVPIRLKALHFMNTTSVMDFILGLMKPFMKKELMDSLFLHNTLKSLEKHIPLEILPNEAGGKAGPMMDIYDKVLKNVEANRDFYLEEEATMRVNETLRPGKAKSASDLFGIEGSFKKLDID